MLIKKLYLKYGWRCVRACVRVCVCVSVYEIGGAGGGDADAEGIGDSKDPNQH